MENGNFHAVAFQHGHRENNLNCAKIALIATEIYNACKFESLGAKFQASRAITMHSCIYENTKFNSR